MLGLAIPLGLDILLVLPVGIGFRIADGVLDVAPGLFGFALHLLGGAFSLRAGIAGPFADLALRAAYRVVNCTLHSVLIHNSTSWWLLFGTRNLGPET